jgi:hypothetical protein
MALGFKDCCNQYNYFYLNGVPGTVNLGEIYLIITSRNLEFCGQYVEVPKTNYNVPTYTVKQMVKQISCNNCISLNPCPLELDLEFSNYTASSVGEIGNVGITTIIPMTVSCSPSVQPLVSGTTGEVKLSIQGGTPPYKVFSSQTQNLLVSCQQTQNVLIYNNAKIGVYNLRIEDSLKDYVIEISCEISIPPTPLTITTVPTSPSIYGKNDGSISLVPSGGTPPFYYTFSGITNQNQSSQQYNNLLSGTYSFNVYDSGLGNYLQTVSLSGTIENPAQIVYPENLCFEFNFCQQFYQLSFSKTINIENYRPIYECNNPLVIGANSINMVWSITNFTGWTIPYFQHSGFTTPDNCSIKNFAEFRQVISQEQPIGDWACINGTFLNTKISTLSGTCDNKMLIEIDSNNACSSNNLLGSITIKRNGGVPPFYYHYGNNIVNYPTINNILPGQYVVYVVDANNTVSNLQTVTITDASSVDILPPNNISSNHTQSITLSPQNVLNISLSDVIFNLAELDNGVVVNADLQITILLTYPHLSGQTDDTFAVYQQSVIESLSSFNIGENIYTLSSPNILNISGTTCECGNNTLLQTNTRQYLYSIPVEFTYNNNTLSGNVFTQYIYNQAYTSTCSQLNDIKSVLKYRIELSNIKFTSGCLNLGDSTNNYVENYWVINNQNTYGVTLTDFGTTNPNLLNVQLC